MFIFNPGPNKHKNKPSKNSLTTTEMIHLFFSTLDKSARTSEGFGV